MSSDSGRMTNSKSASVRKPMSSDRLKKRELMIMTQAFLFLFSDFGSEQTLRTHHQDGDDAKQRQNLGHRPRHEELHGRLRLGDRKGGGDGAEQAGGAAEDDDQEGVDDIELAGGGTGRADHG